MNSIAKLFKAESNQKCKSKNKNLNLYIFGAKQTVSFNILEPRSSNIAAIERILEDITTNNNKLSSGLLDTNMIKDIDTNYRVHTLVRVQSTEYRLARWHTYVDVREPDVLSSVWVEENIVFQVWAVGRKEMGDLKGPGYTWESLQHCQVVCCLTLSLWSCQYNLMVVSSVMICRSSSMSRMFLSEMEMCTMRGEPEIIKKAFSTEQSSKQQLEVKEILCRKYL